MPFEHKVLRSLFVPIWELNEWFDEQSKEGWEIVQLVHDGWWIFRRKVSTSSNEERIKELEDLLIQAFDQGTQGSSEEWVRRVKEIKESRDHKDGT